MNTDRYLIVVLHAYNSSPEKCKYMVEAVKEVFHDPEVWVPRLPVHMFSWKHPDQIVNVILDGIDKRWETGAWQRLILVGHSLGASLVRKLYVAACGSNEDAPIEEGINKSTVRPWAANVERIILMAGVNKGWTINHQLSLKNAILFRLGSVIGNCMALFGHRPIIYHIKKGAPFITQLRLQWLSMIQHAGKKMVGNAITVQLLGTIDDMVSPEDDIDLVTGHSFKYLEVPLSGHKNVIEMDVTPAGEKRRTIFKAALTKTAEELNTIQVIVAENKPLQPRSDITDVVFVIHGIRDRGYWTQKIAKRVKVLGDSHGRKFETETSTYGYFPMLSFLLYPVRRAKVEWLMDQYTENKAMYPDAHFSFVGHSNGTYLLAKALQEYPACRFKNVVFARSVVKHKYDWNKLMREKRVQKVFNFVATEDLVVAIFPKTFQTLRLQDLGSAGLDGFITLPDNQQLKYIKGGHGAGLKEILWNEIASIIVTGEMTGNGFDEVRSVKQPRWAKIASYCSPLIFASLIILLSAIGIVIWTGAANDPVLRFIYLLIYTYVIWKIITRL